MLPLPLPLIALVLVCGSLTIWTEPARSAPDGATDDQALPALGTNLQHVMNTLIEGGDDQVVEDQLEAAAAGGIEFARIDTTWHAGEPKPPQQGTHTYEWQNFDAQFAALARHGIRALPMVGFTPYWAKDQIAWNAGCKPQTGQPAIEYADDFAAFVKAFVQRYGLGGSFWSARPYLPALPIDAVELWNEPNLWGLWCPYPDPERFAVFALAAAGEAHAVDPTIEVIAAGLTSIEDRQYAAGLDQPPTNIPSGEYLRRMVAAAPELQGQIDTVGYHPYSNQPERATAMLGLLRRQMEAAGLGAAEISVDEYGWLRAEEGYAAGIGEQLRATFYQEATEQMASTDCRLSHLTAHAWTTAELSLSNGHDWWGLADPTTASLYPSAEGLFEAYRRIRTGQTTALGVCYGSWPDHSPEPGAGFFGTGLPYAGETYSARRIYLDAFREAGLGFVLQRLDWQGIEPHAPGTAGPEQYQWSSLNEQITWNAWRGVRTIPLLISSSPPDWARQDEITESYLSLLEALARRYGSGGSFWTEAQHLRADDYAMREYPILAITDVEIGNQAELYQQARARLRAIDGRARALVLLDTQDQPGLDGIKTLGALRGLAAASDAPLDGVLVETYGLTEVDQIVSQVKRLRRSLDGQGEQRARIWVGFGASTRGFDGLSERARANFYRDVAGQLTLSNCRLGGAYSRSWVSAETSADNPSDWTGIVEPTSGAFYPAGRAYAAAIARLPSGGRPPEQIRHCRDLPYRDDLAPRIRIAGGSAAARSGRGLRVQVQEPNLRSVDCRWDDGRWRKCHQLGGQCFTVPAQRWLEVRAVDRKGNRSRRVFHLKGNGRGGSCRDSRRL